MSIHRASSWSWLLCLTAALLGCSAAEEPSEQAGYVATASTQDASVTATTDSPAAPAELVQESAEARRAEFSPPFPQRTELFEPPKRIQAAVRRDDQGETVELKGFVHVDQPRVVLSIDGVISPIAEGDERYGVQVISIQPPSVIYQRGRIRETLTLQ